VLRVFGLVINEMKLNLEKLFFKKDNYSSLLHFYLFLNNLARQKKNGDAASRPVLFVIAHIFIKQ
jgi:hypothetical protein